MEWAHLFRAGARLEVLPTMHLGAGVARALDAYKLSVKNRRIKVAAGSEHTQFEPVFKGCLWKVKATGDGMHPSDWFKRDMWLSRNGSLVYWSTKEQRELVYYTSSDLATVQLAMIPDRGSCKPWAFQVL